MRMRDILANKKAMRLTGTAQPVELHFLVDRIHRLSRVQDSWYNLLKLTRVLDRGYNSIHAPMNPMTIRSTLQKLRILCKLWQLVRNSM
jgi:hypothetical protein